VKTTAEYRDRRSAVMACLAPSDPVEMTAGELLALLDDLDELRECLRLAEPRLAHFSDPLPHRIAAALREPKEPHAT
jgi:hypothetical protein